MKRNIYLSVIITVLLLTGCGKKDQMTNFIPTPIPGSEDSSDVDIEEGIEDGSETGTEVSPTPKELHVGQTKTMYVKLDKYGALLNIRATPSKDGKVVGILVHTEKVEVIELVEGWASIAVGNEKCYVSADFLVEKRPDYIDPPSPSPTPENTPTPKSTPTPKNTPTPKITPTPTPDPNQDPPEI